MADRTCGERCLKCLLIIFNFVFWVAGIAVLAVGLWMSFDNRVENKSSAVFFTGVHIEVAVGALIIVVGFVGCCAVIKAEKVGKLGMVSGLLIQTVAGFAVLASGLWLRFDKRVVPPTADNSDVFLTAAHILVAVGVLILVVGFMGCYGAIKESMLMLGLFFGFMIVIFALDVAAATLAFSNRSKVVDEETEFYTQTYNSYNATKNMKDREILHRIHRELNCCGTKGPEKNLQDICPESVTKGCPEVIGEFFKKQMLLIGGLGVCIALVMIFGMVLSVCLCSVILRSKYSLTRESK